MLLFDAPLTFRELMTHEEVPLATVFREILMFLAGRDDAVLQGAQAVNAYVDEERMTGDVDVLSTRARGLAEEIRSVLALRFHIATRVREVVPNLGFRVYQLRQPRNRHLVDLRQVGELPPSREIEGVRVLAPIELVASKVMSMVERRGRPKAGTDLVDVQRLLLAMPELKREEGPVLALLQERGAPEAALARWRELARQAIEPDLDDW